LAFCFCGPKTPSRGGSPAVFSRAAAFSEAEAGRGAENGRRGGGRGCFFGGLRQKRQGIRARGGVPGGGLSRGSLFRELAGGGISAQSQKRPAGQTKTAICKTATLLYVNAFMNSPPKNIPAMELPTNGIAFIIFIKTINPQYEI
jgi:hypothetical protein